MKYLVSYDLNSPGKDYASLYAALRALGAERALLSQWIVSRYGTTARGILDALLPYIDANDRMLVSALESGDWASYRLMVNLNAA